MAFFRSKSHQVEAWQYNGQPESEWPSWLDIIPMEPLIARGEWIIRSRGGEHAIMTDDEFRAAYDPVPEIG